MSRTSPSFLDRLVGEPNGACRVRLGGDQSQRRSACVLKEPLALAQDQRTDDERILIDEVMVHERADKVATTQDHYVLTKLLLELGHFFGDIALDQPGIVPCHLLQGGGKLGQICTNFEVKHRKSARIVRIDHSEPGETAPHLVSSTNTL